MNCSKCGAKNSDSENFCSSCGSRLAAQPSEKTTAKSPPAISATATTSPSAAATTRSSNTTFLLLAALIVISGIVIVSLIFLSGPKTHDPGPFVAPNIPIDQAIEQGYPVICRTEGVVDGMPRNYNVYLHSPKYATENRDSGNLFYIYDGQVQYSWPYYMDDPSWEADYDPYMLETPLEFLNGYRELGIKVDCQIVERIPDSKFAAPRVFSEAEEEDICPGPEFDILEEGYRIRGAGETNYNGQDLCRLDVTGKDADACGGLFIYIDMQALMQDYSSGPAQHVSCLANRYSAECQKLCNYMVTSISDSF